MGIKLVVVGGKQAGMEIPVRRSKFLIGRGEDCHLRPQSHTISRKHCLIRTDQGTAAIEDCGSTNGTLVNGEKIEQRREINDGDRIKVGVLELEVRIPASEEVKKEEKKKAEVHTGEASAPTVAVSNDDLEISKWLADDDVEDQTVSAPMKKSDDESTSSAIHDTIVGKPTDETTTTIPTKESPPEEKKQPITGRFKQPAKPKAESSRSAAEDMLRQFFPGKKS